MKYYVNLAQKVAIPETEGKPVHVNEFCEVNLPDGDRLTVRGKNYPAYKVAMAVASGQITIEDITN